MVQTQKGLIVGLRYDDPSAQACIISWVRPRMKGRSMLYKLRDPDEFMQYWVIKALANYEESDNGHPDTLGDSRKLQQFDSRANSELPRCLQEYGRENSCLDSTSVPKVTMPGCVTGRYTCI